MSSCIIDVAVLAQLALFWAGLATVHATNNEAGSDTMRSRLLYAGRLHIDGRPYDGLGWLKIEIKTRRARAALTPDLTATRSDDVGVGAQRVTFLGGYYTIQLGYLEPAPHGSKLATAGDSGSDNLVVWFNDGTNGWHRFPDVPFLPSEAVREVGVTADRSTETLGTEDELKHLRSRVISLEGKLMGERTVDRGARERSTLRVALRQETHTSPTPHGAPPTLLVFTDYQCPFCVRFYQETFPRLKAKYLDTGKLRFVSRNRPSKGHPEAHAAARAAHCADAHGKLLPMAEQLFRHSERLNPALIVRLAADAGLDSDSFQSCLVSAESAAAVEADIAAAKAAGITGTPSFILGRMNAAGDLEGELIEGAKPFAEFQRRIEALLRENP